MKRRTLIVGVLSSAMVVASSGLAVGAPALHRGRLVLAPARTEVVVPKGRIALVRGRPREIWLIKPDGSDPQQLTNIPGATQPSWSPDAASITFAAPGDDGGTDIWTIATDDPSAEAFQVTHGMHAAHPAWSPDGEWIAFESANDGSIWLVHPDGTGQEQLTRNHVDREPAWSPDASHVVFVRSVDGSPPVAHEISVIDRTVYRGNTNQFVDDPTYQASLELALVKGRGAKRRIVQGNGAVFMTSLRPSWNPMFVRGMSEIAYLAATSTGTSLVLANLPSQRTGQPGRAHVLIPSVDGTDLAWEPTTDPCLNHDVPNRITCARALQIARRGIRFAPEPPLSMWALLTGHHHWWYVVAEGYTESIPTPFPVKYPCWTGTSSFLINATTGHTYASGADAWNVPCP